MHVKKKTKGGTFLFNHISATLRFGWLMIIPINTRTGENAEVQKYCKILILGTLQNKHPNYITSDFGDHYPILLL